MASQRKVNMKSWDHAEIFEVDEAVAQESQILKDLIEDMGVESIIPIPNVSRDILAKVLEHSKYHVEAVKRAEDNPAAAHDEIKRRDEEIKRWDQEFVKVDLATLLHIINAASFLNMKQLLDFTCQTMADIIEDKSPEEIRAIFNIKNDFTPEKEAEVRMENKWAFDSK